MPAKRKGFQAPHEPRSRLFADFPPAFERLKQVYAGQVFHPEHHRGSVADFVAHALRQVQEEQLAAALTDPGSLLPHEHYRLRLFYWSTTCFYRALYLLASHLALDRLALGSWAHVTGYYCKFYLVKALLALFQTTWVAFDRERHGRGGVLLLYFGADGLALLSGPAQKKVDAPRGSHERWWWMFEQLNHVDDWGEMTSIRATLSNTYFNPGRRNEVNYSEVFHEGFNELEWSDMTPTAMLSQLRQVSPRSDRDITSLSGFFEGCDPELADAGDYYMDDAVNLWHDLRNYLALVEALRVRQSLLTREKITILVERFISPDFPKVAEAMLKQIHALNLLEEAHPR